MIDWERGHLPVSLKSAHIVMHGNHLWHTMELRYPARNWLSFAGGTGFRSFVFSVLFSAMIFGRRATSMFWWNLNPVPAQGCFSSPCRTNYLKCLGGKWI